MNFGLVFLPGGLDSEGNPSDKIMCKNFISVPTFTATFTTSTGLILYFNHGTNLYFATSIVEGSRVTVPLFDYLNREVLDEIYNFLIDLFKIEMELVFDEVNHRYEITDISPVEASSHEHNEIGGQFQRSYRMVFSQGLGGSKWLKFDLMLKGNRSFSSLRKEITSELDKALGALNMYEKPPFDNVDPKPSDSNPAGDSFTGGDRGYTFEGGNGTGTTTDD